MKLSMILLTLLLVSCGKSGSNTSSGKSGCKPSKQLMSTWTSRSTGNVFLMSTCQVGEICLVKYGAGSCSDTRGDFYILVNADNTALMADCSGNLIEQATYELGCDNILSLTYESNGETEIFD